MTTLVDRIAAVQTRIESAAIAAGRAPSSIRLLAVSKLHPAEAIREAYAAGLRHFGENYPQELADKADRLADLPDIEWHLIGHLQSNKARLVARVAHAIESVDSVRLATELGKRAATAGRTLNVLVEANIAGEDSKTGCDPSELSTVLAAVRASPSLTLRGLMAIPPYADDPAAARAYFVRLRELRDLHGGSAVLPELSMGMSHDLEVAIAEGATIVRVGTAIFGDRPV